VWFTRPMTLSIVLRGMTKNSCWPLFWGSRVIYMKYDIPYILERDD
jgi:hypothetical protein